jgi:hypothetical protein
MQDTWTLQSKSSALFAFWMVRFWFCALSLASRYRLFLLTDHTALTPTQSQTITVDRQMRRYNVPRVSFINKMDRAGANPWRVVNQIRTKLRLPAAAVQVPIGVEDELKGVVDLIRWKAVYNKGQKGYALTSNLPHKCSHIKH